MDSKNDGTAMTDREIIQALIARDEQVTADFFFGKCRPLFCSVINLVFDGAADYDELVNELYLYLMENDAARLRGFEYRSSVYQWLKVLSIRFFIRHRGRLIEGVSQENTFGDVPGSSEPTHDAGDLERLLDLMPNRRYAMVITRLVLQDQEPEILAREMHVTTANLYNIKRRAMAQLTRIALKDIQEYGKQ